MIRHMYETEDALTERRPLCTALPHHHPVHPDPVCPQCVSIGMHLKSATIRELRITVAELEAELNGALDFLIRTGTLDGRPGATPEVTPETANRED